MDDDARPPSSLSIPLGPTRVDQILAESVRIEQDDAEFVKHIRDEDRERVLKNGGGDS